MPMHRHASSALPCLLLVLALGVFCSLPLSTLVVAKVTTRVFVRLELVSGAVGVSGLLPDFHKPHGPLVFLSCNFLLIFLLIWTWLLSLLFFHIFTFSIGFFFTSLRPCVCGVTIFLRFIQPFVSPFFCLYPPVLHVVSEAAGSVCALAGQWSGGQRKNVTYLFSCAYTSVFSCLCVYVFSHFKKIYV